MRRSPNAEGHVHLHVCDFTWTNPFFCNHVPKLEVYLLFDFLSDLIDRKTCFWYKFFFIASIFICLTYFSKNCCYTFFYSWFSMLSVSSLESKLVIEFCIFILIFLLQCFWKETTNIILFL